MDEFIQGTQFIHEVGPFVQALAKNYESLKCELSRGALLEELILLHQAKQFANNPKFSLVANRYIYARVPMYRRDISIKEVRVIVATLSQDESYAVCIADAELQRRASRMLVKEIQDRIDMKMNEYHSNYGPLSIQIA